MARWAAISLAHLTRKDFTHMKRKVDVYQLVTDQILSSLEKGVVPWRKPWKTDSLNAGMPSNFVSSSAYRGINVWLLSMMPFASNLWGSWKQIHDKGGSVIKDQQDKGTVIVFWKIVEVKDQHTPDATKKIPFLRYYRVYNLDQTEGMEKYTEVNTEGIADLHDPIEEAELIWENYGERPSFLSGKELAAYHPGEDRILMPDAKFFTSMEEYYSTLFHEAIHSTGHKDRLNRLTKDSYAKEELTAEMGAAFLTNIAGLDTSGTMDNSAAYIKTWMSRIKEDKKLVVNAGAKAQKAAEWILTPREVDMK
jgi:antirestriction protein ArdC